MWSRQYMRRSGVVELRFKPRRHVVGIRSVKQGRVKMRKFEEKKLCRGYLQTVYFHFYAAKYNSLQAYT